jgi:cephalosporin hydroxylase
MNPMRLPSIEAAQRYQNGSLDFVFIDAAHDYENVRADILAWRPKVKVGGYLGGHDFILNYPGVIQAVHELVPNAAVIGTSWLTQIS